MDIRQPGGHLDQMMRQTRAHHVQLSLMADRKANMMMTVASLLVPLSLRYIQSPEFLIGGRRHDRILHFNGDPGRLGRHAETEPVGKSFHENGCERSVL